MGWTSPLHAEPCPEDRFELRSCALTWGEEREDVLYVVKPARNLWQRRAVGDGSAGPWPSSTRRSSSVFALAGCAVPMPRSFRESQESWLSLLTCQARYSTEHSQKTAWHHSPLNLLNTHFPLQPEELELASPVCLRDVLSPRLWSAGGGSQSASPAEVVPLCRRHTDILRASRREQRQWSGRGLAAWVLFPAAAAAPLATPAQAAAVRRRPVSPSGLHHQLHCVQNWRWRSRPHSRAWPGKPQALLPVRALSHGPRSPSMDLLARGCKVQRPHEHELRHW